MRAILARRVSWNVGRELNRRQILKSVMRLKVGSGSPVVNPPWVHAVFGKLLVCPLRQAVASIVIRKHHVQQNYRTKHLPPDILLAVVLARYSSLPQILALRPRRFCTNMIPNHEISLRVIASTKWQWSVGTFCARPSLAERC